MSLKLSAEVIAANGEAVKRREAGEVMFNGHKYYTKNV